MKHYLLLASLFASQAFAAPTMSADPVPVTGVQPASAEWQIQGAAAWLPCSLTGSPKEMACDLASIVTPGTYQLVARFNYVAGCNATGTCWAAGAAVSAPFAYSWIGVPVLKPTVLRIGTP
jgi:hypothetical protein